MNKLQTCLLFIIALPIIVVLFTFIGIPLFILSLGSLSSLISGIREALLPIGCIFAAITTIGIINYIITSRKHKKIEMEMEKREKEREMEMEMEMEEREKEREMEIARFEALSTPEEYVAYYEEKLQEQRKEVQERRVYLQGLKANGMLEEPVGQDSRIRFLFEEITVTKRTIKRYKNMIDLPQGSHEI